MDFVFVCRLFFFSYATELFFSYTGGFFRLHVGLFLKLGLWSFNVMNTFIAMVLILSASLRLDARRRKLLTLSASQINVADKGLILFITHLVSRLVWNREGPNQGKNTGDGIIHKPTLP